MSFEPPDPCRKNGSTVGPTPSRDRVPDRVGADDTVKSVSLEVTATSVSEPKALNLN